MTGWFVEIVRWGLKVRCIAKSTQTFRPEDGHPASNYKLPKVFSMNLQWYLNPVLSVVLHTTGNAVSGTTLSLIIVNRQLCGQIDETGLPYYVPLSTCASRFAPISIEIWFGTVKQRLNTGIILRDIN
jgi:hypothetical protein